jgi:hypothetical protein
VLAAALVRRHWLEATHMPQAAVQVWYLQLLVQRCFTLVGEGLDFIEAYLALLLQVKVEQVAVVMEALL